MENYIYLLAKKLIINYCISEQGVKNQTSNILEEHWPIQLCVGVLQHLGVYVSMGTVWKQV